MRREIYIVTHKEFDGIAGECFKTIQVGSASLDRHDADFSDSTGDNISEKNGSFCELTALYWVWKNTKDQDQVGFFHYRRHMNFSSRQGAEDRWGVVEYACIDEEYCAANELTDEGAQAFIGDHDLVLPKKWDVRNGGSRDMKDHYRRGEHTHIADYEKAIDILIRKYPEYSEFVRVVNGSREGYFTNMFIMKRAIFDQYCAWLFDILFELERTIDISRYSPQEKRVFGFISEWLFNVFIEKYVSDHKEARTSHAQRTFVKHPYTYVKPAFPPGAVSVVMALDKGFSPYAAAAIQSMIDTSGAGHCYDIVVMHENVCREHRNALTDLAARHDAISIRFINVGFIFDAFRLKIHSHFSRAVYYRLCIPNVFKKYERVIYLDADLICKRDLNDLYRVQSGDKSLCAVRDFAMMGFRALKSKCMLDCGDYDAQSYLEEYLGLADADHYFQAGILVFNLGKIGPDKIRRIMDIVSSGKIYWFLDQDILNAVFDQDVFFLDPRWNVVHGNGKREQFCAVIPAPERRRYLDSRKEPFIIHYAGERKPWLDPLVDYSKDFWDALRKTPWYEYVLLTGRTGGATSASRWSAVRKRLKPVLAVLFPPDSVQRKGLRRAFTLYRRWSASS